MPRRRARRVCSCWTRISSVRSSTVTTTMGSARTGSSWRRVNASAISISYTTSTWVDGGWRPARGAGRRDELFARIRETLQRWSAFTVDVRGFVGGARGDGGRCDRRPAWRIARTGCVVDETLDGRFQWRQTHRGGIAKELTGLLVGSAAATRSRASTSSRASRRPWPSSITRRTWLNRWTTIRTSWLQFNKGDPDALDAFGGRASRIWIFELARNSMRNWQAPRRVRAGLSTLLGAGELRGAPKGCRQPELSRRMGLYGRV